MHARTFVFWTIVSRIGKVTDEPQKPVVMARLPRTLTKLCIYYGTEQITLTHPVPRYVGDRYFGRSPRTKAAIEHHFL